MDIFEFLSGPWWYGVSTIALVVTLGFVIFYAFATYSMAKSTKSIVGLQREDVGLQKRPVVSFACYDETKFEFHTFIKNLSMVHAKARVKATIKINDKIMKLPSGTHYTGERIWHLQAGGPTGFHGHLDFKNVLRDNEVEGELTSARVTIESWVINFWEDESALNDKKNKNPIAQWYWHSDPEKMKWIPEVAPSPES